MPAVAKTRLPWATASWMAIVPMPELPPCTRKVSPGTSAAAGARSSTIDQTVQATSGSAAALIRSRPAGTRISCTAGTQTRSAYPPPVSSAHTSSPTCQPVTPSPRPAIRPLHSSPRIGEAPGGGG